MFTVAAIIVLFVAGPIAARRARLGAGAEALPMRGRGARWQKLIWLVMFIGTIIATVTSIPWVMARGGPIGGWVLILHCLAAPLFAIGIALVALVWAGAYMRGACGGGCTFWLMLLSGLITIFSIAFTMTPLFGTAEQHLLLAVHRWSSLALFFFMILHAGSVFGAMRAARRAGA
jgi:hypothetical protein